MAGDDFSATGGASASGASDPDSSDTRSLRPGDAVGASRADADASGLLPAGTRIAEYEIVEPLGEGGMGVVYRARQVSPDRDVALKLIRGRSLTRDAIKRFEFEAHVLGRLQHPGVAAIYGAGVHAGDPFFVMELVDGEPLTRFADRAGLSVKQRLELISRICDAVQHAHTKGVVHRDLKPGNILVTRDGMPKILDFGVARATDSDIQTATIQTEIGQLVGTIPYMSPEQASGDPDSIDTRSDVYALGVIAYELLAGRLPHDLRAKMIHEAVRVIREDDPAPLSSVHRSLRGDVEIIIGKALAKEKERRYQSASDLASDIGRYLHDEPIEARAPSASYQLRKFARRNRPLVAGASAALAALVLGLAGTLWQASRAAERARVAVAAEARAVAEADRAAEAELAARREAIAATTVADFLASMLDGVGPGVARGRDTELLREIADNAVARVDSELADQPEVRARMLRTLGVVYHDLADYPRAEELISRAVESAEAAPGDNRVPVARAMFDLARVIDSVGRYDDALAAYQESRDMYVAAGAGDTPDGLTALSGIGGTLVKLNRNAEAVDIFRSLLSAEREAAAATGVETAKIAAIMDRLSIALGQIGGDPDEIERLSRESLAVRRRTLGENHPDILLGMVNLAAQISRQGQHEEAISLVEDGVRRHREVFGDRHPYTAMATNSAAIVYQRAGRDADEIAARRETLDIFVGSLGPDARQTLDAVWLLGSALERLGEHAGAEEQYRAMLKYTRDNYPPGERRISNVIMMVASSLTKQGRHADAEPLLREALGARAADLPAGHPQIAQSRGALVACLVAQYKFADAEPVLLAAYESAAEIDADAAREAAAALVSFYETWAAADPSRAADAERWRETRSRLESPSP